MSTALPEGEPVNTASQIELTTRVIDPASYNAAADGDSDHDAEERWLSQHLTAKAPNGSLVFDLPLSEAIDLGEAIVDMVRTAAHRRVTADELAFHLKQCPPWCTFDHGVPPVEYTCDAEHGNGDARISLDRSIVPWPVDTDAVMIEVMQPFRSDRPVARVWPSNSTPHGYHLELTDEECDAMAEALRATAVRIREFRAAAAEAAQVARAGRRSRVAA